MGRYALAHALSAILLTVVAADSIAQSAYPVRPLRLIVPSSAGGGIDIIARIITARLAERLGQPVLVDNRPGAASIIGSDLVAKAVPDGYTLLISVSALAINPAIYKKLPYDTLRDFAPVTLAVVAPNLLVVHPSLPVKTVRNLIDLARARPGELNFGSAGTGSNPHLSMELLLSMAKLKMVHIPYKGSAPAVTDLLAGHIAAMTATMLTGIPHARSGRLRALGVTSAARVGALPEIPTVAEAGVPGYEAVQWYGILAPAATPAEIVKKLNAEIVGILGMPEVKTQLAGNGAEATGGSAEAFARYLRTETEKWAQVVRAAGIQPE